MSRGVPVITSNTSALPEVAGNAAVLVNPYSTAEISSALLQLASDENLRQRLSVAGFERAKAFSWNAAVERTYSVYLELMR
jgi:glycosyltransferase involved in cell wall biosynthesis